MFGILQSFGNYLFNLFFKGATIKFVVLAGLGYIFGWLLDLVTSVIDISPLSGLQGLLDALPPGVLFFMGVFRLDVGIPLCLAAMGTKFLIRRIPFIG